jgi:truncated hemoglobin YjbI
MDSTSLPLRSRLALVFQELDRPKGMGEKRLQGILTDFYHELTQDILVGFFFDSKDLDRIRSQQQAFLLKAMGVRSSYEGKPPALAHTELPPILTGHFDRRMKVLEKHLRQAGLSEISVTTWLEFENAFRTGIVDS